MALTVLDDVKEAPSQEPMIKSEIPDPPPPEKPREEETELPQDPDPEWPRESLVDRIFSDDATDAPPRHVSAAIRKDIRAKTSMMLMVLGSTWAHRDRYCGEIFVHSVPDRTMTGEEGKPETVPGIATALTDIFCDSPDIVKWFTASGKYMKWLTLATSLQPIAGAVLRHHITHSQEYEEQENDWSLYEAV